MTRSLDESRRIIHTAAKLPRSDLSKLSLMEEVGGGSHATRMELGWRGLEDEMYGEENEIGDLIEKQLSIVSLKVHSLKRKFALCRIR